jgi:hypothetical protein
MEQLSNANTFSPQYLTNEPVAIADEDIGNSSIFKEFIFQSIYRRYKIGDTPIKTIAQAQSTNRASIFFGTIFSIFGIFMVLAFMGSPIGFPFLILIFPLIGIFVFFI